MKQLYVIIGFLCLTAACVHEPVTPEVQTYMPLRVGNYWIYQIYTTQNGRFEPTNKFDSTYVSSDTFINGNRFFKIVSTYGAVVKRQFPNNVFFVRDSADFLLRFDALIGQSKFFSYTDFTNILDFRIERFNSVDTIYTLTTRMQNNVNVETPLGNFTALVSEKMMTLNYRFSNTNATETRRMDTHFFVQNKGIVKSILYGYANTPELDEEKRLVRFNIQ